MKSPREIAGIRLPDVVRHSVDTLINSPLGREILADALVAAAAAAAAALVKRPIGKQPLARPVIDRKTQAAAATKELADTAAAAVGTFISDAVQNLLPSPGATKQSRPRIRAAGKNSKGATRRRPKALSR
jgi:hypothetical protein